MPRKFFRRIIPSTDSIKGIRGFAWIQPYIVKYQLLSLTRHSTSKAFFIGFFVAALPPLPVQMLIAAAMAVVFRANLPLSTALVWVSNPLTIGPIFILEWWLGSLLLGRPTTELNFDLTKWWELVGDIGLPLMTGALAWGLLSGLIAYSVIQIIWRIAIVTRRKTGKVPK